MFLRIKGNHLIISFRPSAHLSQWVFNGWIALRTFIDPVTSQIREGIGNQQLIIRYLNRKNIQANAPRFIAQGGRSALAASGQILYSIALISSTPAARAVTVPIRSTATIIMKRCLWLHA